MHQLLFDRASTDCVDEVYRRNPHLTRGVDSDDVKKAVRWQVYKDRSNWQGKTPKRVMVFGPTMPFSWREELQTLRDLKAKEKRKLQKRKLKPEPKP